MKKTLKITVEGKTYEVEVEEIGSESSPSTAKVAPISTAKSSQPVKAVKPAEAPKVIPLSQEGEAIVAPLPGKVLSLQVKVGDQVSAGQVVLILEAMKMENEIIAPVDGQIKEVIVSEGQAVGSGDIMILMG